ncbi:MAG: hypothetical protein ACR2PL_26030 [Dehalococcoidia bacterium]
MSLPARTAAQITQISHRLALVLPNEQGDAEEGHAAGADEQDQVRVCETNYEEEDEEQDRAEDGAAG